MTKIVSFIFLFLFLAVPPSVFIFHFYTNGFSQDVSAWGNFGSYMWGYLSCISSIIYVCLFYKLTLKLNEVQIDAAFKNVHQQRIAVTATLQTNAVITLKQTLDLFPKNRFDEIGKKDIVEAMFVLDDFTKTYPNLFVLNTSDITKLIDSLTEIEKCKENVELDSRKAIANYLKNKQELFKNLNGQIIGNITSVAISVSETRVK